MSHILVTGGAGYIGSHVCVELLKSDYEVTVVDNLSNSKVDALRRVEEIAGKPLTFFQIDLRDESGLQDVFEQKPVDAVIHFAALKAVGESVAIPMSYYQQNMCGAINLLFVMRDHGVQNLVFSSSATVYGQPKSLPIKEDSQLGATNPYGRTKLYTEEMLRDIYKADSNWQFALLRYFNPVGAHESGRIGEDPTGIPNNLLPYITQVAVGRLETLPVFGDDYETPDGTPVRDYIHVVDLAEGHVRALEKLETKPGLVTYNLGTGRGNSVREVIEAFEAATGLTIPYQIVGRRPGDVAQIYADPSLAQKELGWRAQKSLQDMCADAWRWQVNNPNGY